MTPYQYVSNNPIMLIDPNGKNAVVTIKGNTMTVKSTIYIHGHGATKDKAKSIEKGIKSFWGSNHTYVDKANNKRYNVVFDVDVQVKPTDYNGVKEVGKSFDEGHFNIVELMEGDFRSIVLGNGFVGQWGESDSDNTYAHEFGHLLGIADMYYPSEKEVGKYENYQGVDENDIMGKNMHKKDARVSQENIDGIAEKVLRDKDSNNQARIGGSYGRSRDNKNLCK